jgi:hypothetical protein
MSAHLSKLRVTAYAYLANPAELEVVLHPVKLRLLFSSFWPWRRSSPLRSNLWRGGSGSSRICGCTRVTRKWVSLSFTRDDEDGGILVGYPGLKMKDAVSFFVWIRRCTSSVQCWAVLTKPLTLTDEWIIGAAASDILGDVGISSVPRVLQVIFWNRPAFVAWHLSFPPHLYVELLSTSVRTEAKPDVLEQDRRALLRRMFPPA